MVVVKPSSRKMLSMVAPECLWPGDSFPTESVLTEVKQPPCSPVNN